ncbi:MAG: transcription elongation factor GreA [Micavibrio sp.]|nr:transcription elongation factor GreA [Micavibrio sp.]|tara:strand:- start:86 stop:568 length:483 start_codon:yes stop_codon:yes gene_type:complete
MDKVPMTQNGYDKLVAELKDLKSNQRPAVIAAIAEAREHGDLSENAEYHAAREQQSFIEGRIQELEGVIGAADVIDITKFSGETVKFGATVTIVDEETDEEKTVQIVGAYESDADNGQISLTSPIARALIGKSVGDSVTVRTPKGEADYEILDVEYKKAG